MQVKLFERNYCDDKMKIDDGHDEGGGVGRSGPC